MVDSISDHRSERPLTEVPRVTVSGWARVVYAIRMAELLSKQGNGPQAVVEDERYPSGDRYNVIDLDEFEQALFSREWRQSRWSGSRVALATLLCRDGNRK